MENDRTHYIANPNRNVLKHSHYRHYWKGKCLVVVTLSLRVNAIISIVRRQLRSIRTSPLASVGVRKPPISVCSHAPSKQGSARNGNALLQCRRYGFLKASGRHVHSIHLPPRTNPTIRASFALYYSSPSSSESAPKSRPRSVS